MAKVRQVNTFFWDDPYIEELEPFGKLLFIYLITTPLTNIAGSFEITIKKMHEHTGIDRKLIGDLLATFERDEKVIYREPWMLVVNTIEHQNWRTHETIKKGIVSVVSCSPDWVKHRLGIVYGWLSHLNLNLNLNLNSAKAGGTAAAGIASPSQPSTAQQRDPVESRIWTDGVELLTRCGMKDTAARSLLGRHAKEYGKTKVAECIAVTQAANPANPREYLAGVLQDRAAKKGKADMLVGRAGEADGQPVRCGECFDQGEVSVPRADAQYSFEVEWVPCPSCGPVVGSS